MKKASDDLEHAWRPNLFVAGFPKCGSSALCEYLGQHSEVFVADPKEPNTLFRKQKLALWGGGALGKEHPMVSMRNYHRIFRKEIGRKYRVDGSQPYSRGGESLARKLKAFSPNAKCILILRPHAPRVVSAYNYFYQFHKEKDMQQYIKKYIRGDLEMFLFLKALKAYHKVFKKDLLVLRAEDLQKHPQETMRKVFKWLKLKPEEMKTVQSNANMFSMGDSTGYRSIILALWRVQLGLVSPFIWLMKQSGLYYGNGLVSWVKRNNPIVLFRTGMGALNRKRKNARKPVKIQMPVDLEKIFGKDYKSALGYAKNQGIFLK